MKIRNFLMAGVFLTAIAASLNLKATNSRLMPVTYHPFANPIACITSQVSIECTRVVTPVACTVYEPASGTNRPAFAKDTGTDDCTYPLYIKFF